MTATLLDAPAEAGTHAADLREIPLAELYESPLNPRKQFDATGLAELAESLKGGQLNPVLVRPRPKGGYELAAGHRRRRAAAKAGLTHLLAIVRPMTDEEFLKILVVENGQRADLTAVEEAEGFKALMGLPGYDVTVIAGLVGKSKEYVYTRLKLLQLIPEAKNLLLDGTITPGHGILLARLSKEDQERALALDSSWRGNSGVLEPERVDDSYTLFHEPAEERGPAGTLAKVLDEDGDREPVKARSVRELAQWIDRNVRFVPAKVDQADLTFHLPKTAELLDTAATNKLKVVKITREYRVPDEARDEKERTYGEASWKRADGEPEPFNRYGADPKAKPSKTCDYAVVGLVVAGPGRGEAFRVCVNKDKCAVHWSEEMKQRAQRAKERERAGATQPARDGQPPKPKKVDPNVLPDDLRQKWQGEELAARVPTIVKNVKAITDELKISDEICWNLVQADLYLDSWNKAGKRGYSGGMGTGHRDELEVLVAGQLPGRFDGKTLRAADGPGARAELSWLIWLARDSGGLDEAIDKAVADRWAAQRKAAAKQPKSAQTSAKPKRLAGDVRREKKAKAKKAGK